LVSGFAQLVSSRSGVGNMLNGESKFYKHGKAKTLYLSIPANMVRDSQFIFKSGDKISLIYSPIQKTITLYQFNKTEEEKI
jgi:hypothetical protein